MFDPRKYPPIERNPDGSLIHMTLRQSWAAKRLVKRCCNYINGRCLLLDDGEEVRCPQYSSRSVCCTYFRYVLLKDPGAAALEAELFHGIASRRCERCGKPYIANGNHAKYCDDCKLIVKRKQQAEYARRKRERARHQ